MNTIEQIIFKHEALASKRAAHDIFQWLNVQGKASNIVLATGRTPLNMYASLIELHKNNSSILQQSFFFNLDEYVGYSPKNPYSFAYFLHKHLINPLGIHDSKVFFWDGSHHAPGQAVKDHQAMIKKQGLDLVILGLGQNGHIAFNEPGSKFDSECHIVELTKQTLEANKDLLDPNLPPPQHALTMGIKTILSAKKIVVLAFGQNKARVVKTIFNSEQTIDCPATALQKHSNCTIYLDELSAQYL